MILKNFVGKFYSDLYLFIIMYTLNIKKYAIILENNEMNQKNSIQTINLKI